jgi:predicted nucleotide-binding protein (sugar kinase/HSP70/actin superfamily)
VLNALMYRLRPYELVPGATDEAIAECKQIVWKALHEQTNIIVALWRCRRVLARVEVDRTIPKPKVAIIGEFWAMTTEGDGNYKLQRFLESEGAEVDVQLVTAWLLFMLWEHDHDTRRRMLLRGADDAKKGLAKVDVQKKLVKLWAGEWVVRGLFQLFANAAGLHGYHLPNMHKVAEVSRRFYNNDIRGGEGHMEVGKLIQNVVHNKVTMTLSVKPFGCMPSSGVSDGVQSMITELHPGAIFLPIETSGDGAVNVQSRVQMMLFKARQVAQRESQDALEKWGLTRDEVQSFVKKMPLLGHPLFKSPHEYGSTAADMVELVGKLRNPVKALRLAWEGRGRTAERHEAEKRTARPTGRVGVASAA